MEPLTAEVEREVFIKMRFELVLEECDLLNSSFLAVLPFMAFFRFKIGHNDFM